jgi:hypothetical protein
MPSSRSGASEKVTVTCLIHCDLDGKMAEQREGAWVQGREIDCGYVVSEPPTVLLFLSEP